MQRWLICEGGPHDGEIVRDARAAEGDGLHFEGPPPATYFPAVPARQVTTTEGPALALVYIADSAPRGRAEPPEPGRR